MGIRDVLRIPDYRRVAVAQFVSDFGDAATQLALLLVVNSLTGSLAALATMAIVMAVPALTVGIVAGAWVDRLDPRRVMLASDVLRAIIVLGLIVVHSADQIWILYVLGFLESAVGTFFRPARMTLVSVVVPREGLMAANSLSQGGGMVALVCGSAAAGVMVAASSNYWPAFVTDSLTFVVSFVLLLGVRARIRDRSAGHATSAASSIVAEVRAGFGAVASSPALTATVVAATALMLGVGAVNVLMVPLLINDLGVSPAWLGAVDGAQTVGMVLAAGLFSARLALVAPSRVLVVGLLALAGFTAALAGIGAVWHVVLLVFVAGIIVTPIQASFATLVQTGAAIDIRGRVAAVMNSATSGANILSMAFAGIAGQALGARAVFVLCAVVIATGALISLVLFRRGPRAVLAPAS